MTVAALAALLALLGAALAALGRLGRHTQHHRDQQQLDRRQKALDALPRVIPPTGINHPAAGRHRRPYNWENQD